MLDKLQKKWKVTGIQLILILCTFAIGGSLCGYAARKIMVLLPIEGGVLRGVLYILIVTLLWPFSVMLISVFFGQYKFFKGYLGRVAKRIGLKK